ncbi:26633_t:CDS:1, partial [Racocetra persica]
KIASTTLKKGDEREKSSLPLTLIQKSINVLIIAISVRTQANISQSKLAPYLETPTYLYRSDFYPSIFFQLIKKVSPLVN